MQDLYIIMVVALFGLAITDLIVGVSNDAVNFLNSAIGSKAFSVKTIMVIASLGIAIGATFSSGMMEVARKGIMDPSMFMFSEVMIIFMAVMISDIILLDVFNSLGLPTSTTVSIVFELLGASVSMALWKISQGDSHGLVDYINTDKAILIVSGILLSVLIAFTIGAIVMYISRFIFTFQYEKKIKTVGVIFGGFALTAITYFIIVKGLKGTSFYKGETMGWVMDHTAYVMLASFAFWIVMNKILVSIFKVNILKFIIGIGTFSVALAFAGNDLVNFIGVPMAGLKSYQVYLANGSDPTIMMDALLAKTATPTLYLLSAGIIMVLTLWFSKKAKAVSETELSLSRQDEGGERFEPNFLAKTIVRSSVNFSKKFDKLIPDSINANIDARFDNKTISLPRDKSYTPPMFDLVRASVNLVVASILISIGTSFKLPLSTTYVTFMVAMGTSLADRAWDRESAVYRVSGVINVILGWFSTAFSAFTSAAIMVFLINFGGRLIHHGDFAVIGILLVIAVVLITRSYILHSQKMNETVSESKLRKQDRIDINEIIEESSDNISAILDKSNIIFSDVIIGLSTENRQGLKKSKKANKGLKQEMDRLKGNVFYFIKSMDESSVESSKFYILILDYLQDITQSIEFITKASFDHIDNQHKALKPSQIEDLKNIDVELDILFKDIRKTFDSKSFLNINELIKERKYIQNDVTKLVEKQITRIKTEEASPKNSMLYFSILLETKDLIEATWKLLQLYHDFYTDTVKKLDK
ncbi:MAG: inorganic phosphate transporter [Flavobacteriales bacterium]|nr:inorganic phosphate transporter [Flavobacteriales bacterium]